MKPRWTIRPLHLACGCTRAWFREDRNGGISAVGCVGHHTWTKLVRRFEVIP